MTRLEIEPIGTYHGVYKEKFGTPRQSLISMTEGFVLLKPSVQPEESLQGLESTTHIWLLWQFHLSHQEKFNSKVRVPRLNSKKLGVFSTRSPFRPNSLGLSLVKLEKIERSKLWIKGADLIDGSPIFDIKPYLPEIESQPDAQLNPLLCSDSTSLDFDWTACDLKLEDSKLKEIFEKSFTLDPRPENGKKLSNKSHYILIDCYEFKFRFLNENLVLIERVTSTV